MLTAFFIIYIVTAFIAIGSIILYGSNPSRSLGWILVVIFVPYAGVISYLLFGVNRREFKIFTLKRTAERRLYDQKHLKHNTSKNKVLFKSSKKTKLASLLEKSSNFPAIEGNKVTVLSNGADAYKTIFEKLENAKKFIHIQFYIFEDGEILEKIYQIFKKKIEEGVEIRMIYDAIGSFELKKKSIKKFKALGVEIFPVMPLKFGSIIFTINFRNHRKIIVIDGDIGFTGGVNISDKYVSSQSELGVWDDEHLCIEGPAVESLHNIFIKDFYFASNNESLLEEKYHTKIEKKGNSIVQIVASGPDSDYPTILHQYLGLVNVADDCIYIANPYFMPSRPLLEGIKMAALGGIKIKLLVPKKSDSNLAKYSMQSYFNELLKVGVEIYRSSNFLHSKIIITDTEIASVGSGNFDHRSFEQNFETNALIYDEKVAQEISETFLKDCEKSSLLTLEEHSARPFYNKVLEGFARLFSPLL
ncbi:cardiolipin synthase [Aureibaculum sp. 2210JD6-5]|uniref:cardiolipin synthase n=1 Tax=Aureibaculum sp. 2210JD6-5 TaxID=3103957 RepID=UPI002AAD37E8|nr:cardiolipin synthase [Aureibaculum sp. 2210JD6-5]MDY7396632.1 cardiolipin synthase [Aureibaculum sp. 2210JD6-5]